MAFTTQELEHAAAILLDYHMDKGKIWSQTLQDKPLLDAFEKAKKTFPGGKENISVKVKGAYTTTIMGFEGDDDVTYGNPANAKEAVYPWKEIHWGIKTTITELKKGGISVVDTAQGKSTVQHSESEKIALANILDDKIEDMIEGGLRGMNNMYWKDGTQSAKEVPGVASLILDDPTSAVTVGGLDQSANTWWRNRASLGLSVTTPSNMVIIKTLKSEERQLRRYSQGGPKHIRLCGSAFLDALEAEIYSKGEFTNGGWSKSGTIDVGQAEAALKGVVFQYDPTLDDLGKTKYCYVIDLKSIFPKVMEGEDMKRHNPARPAEKYVLYRAMTWTGGLPCRQRNTSGVYTIA